MREPLDLAAAWRLIANEVRPLGTESVALANASGRLLAVPVRVDRDAPAFDRAAMDGFAVRATEVAWACADTPVELRVVGQLTPGRVFDGIATPCSALAIMTGAAMPAGWDAIVPVEDTTGFGGGVVGIRAAASPGAHIVTRGSERRAGESLYEPGRRLKASDIGALAMVGADPVVVGRRARVAVLATGDELVPHTTAEPEAAFVRDSNGPMVRALASAHAASIEDLGRAIDDETALARALERGLGCDVLVVTGGISMGTSDRVAATLEAAGVRFHFRALALQPGKPTAFGVHADGIVVALPGNPVSALTTFRLIALPILARLEGVSDPRPISNPVPASFAWERRHAKWLVLPGRRRAGAVERVPYAGSGDLLAYARADCQILLPPDRKRVNEGELVDVIALDQLI